MFYEPIKEKGDIYWLINFATGPIPGLIWPYGKKEISQYYFQETIHRSNRQV